MGFIKIYLIHFEYNLIFVSDHLEVDQIEV